MVFWLFLKVFFLYGISFLFSVSIYFYLNRQILPPHRTLQFPLIWREGEIAIVELEKGQRLGGNFYIKQQEKINNNNFPVIQSNVPYDISLLLKYPDRSEIADLGNLKFYMKLFRKDGKEAGKIEGFRALRYESKILRISKEILSLPVALWKDSGSERIERISLVQRLIDEPNFNEKHKEKEKDNFGFDSKKEEEIRKNPIDRLEISINPLPPLHSLHLEILANLSPLQHFLFYWRIPAAVLIIGSCTLTLWLLVTFYALIEVVKIILTFKRGKEETEVTEVVDLSEIEEFKQVIEEDISDDNIDHDDTIEDIVVSVQFPQAESVSNFIGDLRQRKLKTKDEDDAISIYNSDTEDQSVPIGSGDKEE